jgi:hypothetical protein
MEEQEKWFYHELSETFSRAHAEAIFEHRKIGVYVSKLSAVVMVDGKNVMEVPEFLKISKSSTIESVVYTETGTLGGKAGTIIFQNVETKRIKKYVFQVGTGTFHE